MKSDTCYGCYHIAICKDKKTEICDIDNEIIDSHTKKRCKAYSQNEEERIIG